MPISSDSTLAVYAYLAENANGRIGTVTYIVPPNIPVREEMDAADNAVATVWQFPDGTIEVYSPHAQKHVHWSQGANVYPSVREMPPWDSATEKTEMER